MGRLLAAVLLLAACAAGVARAADAPAADPLTALLEGYVPPADDEGALDALQARVQSAADGLEVSPSKDDDARLSSLLRTIDPALKPFFKDENAALDALYRTLALVDDERAARAGDAPCPAARQRDELLSNSDGLFSNLKTGAASPWLVRLFGPTAAGRRATDALESASAPVDAVSSSRYAELRARAKRLSQALHSPDAVGPARAGLWCRRAQVYQSLAGARRAARAGAILAGRPIDIGR